METQTPHTWLTSDLHFGHRLVAGLRGFLGLDGAPDTDAHDEAVIRNWNAVVGPGDIVWVLGDVTLGKSAAAWRRVDRLNGTRHLIWGNHDAVYGGHRDGYRHQAEWREHFGSVSAYARRRLEGQDVLLSHFPYDGDSRGADRAGQFRLRDEGLTLVHGHTHSRGKVSRSAKGTLQIHAGLDAWDLKPVDLGVIQKIIRDDAA